ncbi:APC family permease [Paenibacillus filicis]|uniref:APC family permease n=1 Tax=Paenibacillus gyeongsangnamensis TaxID=3388067 RepID=A0ABT4Q9L1_9BACL|nr:APC family permease [Paenibacillus filicis]MCZ8513564.1 APC family permease [Paenibacillus filicis]
MHSSWIHPVLYVLAVIMILFAFINFEHVKKFLIGRPMRTKELHAKHNKLFWLIALPILSADLYSSVAYGPEAGVTELVSLGPSVKWIILPITAATVILLGMLIVSYIMGVLAYPNGGGGYTIARENFKKPWMSLIAASALLIDYVLTVAVSVSAGIQAIVSAYPIVGHYQTSLSVFCVIFILIVNLRGLSESATIFAWPNFLFIICMIILIIAGFNDEFQHGFIQSMTPPLGTVPTNLTILIILKAFSSACSALTGIETISNAVPIFRDPPVKGAIKAYITMGLLTGVTLIGFAYHLYVKGIPVDPNNTMLSQLATVYFGHGLFYQIITWSTFIILIIAANSTFTGFPQLTALVAADGFLPRSLMIRGDRLGYSNGMIVLAALSALLILAFHAQTNALIPLFAIGVFAAFTVAQIGLTRRWLKVKGSLWQLKALINAIGAVITALVCVVFAITKFKDGAWVVLIALPLIVFAAMAVRKHYDRIADELRIDLKTMHPQKHRMLSVVLISGIHRVVLNSISFAQSMHEEVIALYIGFDDESIEKMKMKWEEWDSPCPLITIKNEYRSLLQPLSSFINIVEVAEGGKPDHIHLILAQFIPNKWWQYALHNQTSLLIRAWFFKNKDVIVTTVPYHLHN